MELIWVGRDDNEAGIYLETKQLEAVLGSAASTELADAIERVELQNGATLERLGN
jgi:hypothetical protein